MLLKTELILENAVFWSIAKDCQTFERLHGLFMVKFNQVRIIEVVVMFCVRKAGCLLSIMYSATFSIQEFIASEFSR